MMLLLALIVTIGLIGCNGKKGNGQADPAANYKAEDMIALINKAYEKVSGLPFVEVMEIDLSDVERIKSLTFLDNLDNLQYVVNGDAMIMTVPYTLVLMKFDEKANIDNLKQAIIDKADLAKWICVFADVAYVNNYGSVIILVMGEKTLADDVYAALQQVASPLGEKLEKFGSN